MERIDFEVNPYHIETLKKHLDKAELKNVYHEFLGMPHYSPQVT